MDVKIINDIRENYGLCNSYTIESASMEILKILEGVQYIKAKAILQKAIELLDTEAKVS